MKRFILAALCLTGTVYIAPSVWSTAQAQNQKVYTVPEQQPEFPGGKPALSLYLAENIKVPGVLVRKNYNTGQVAAKFIVDELGYVHDVRVVTKALDKKTQKGMEDFMASIITAVEKMPRWEPGQVAGKRVPVFYTLPIEVNVH
ncbi:energy transducer TonB [Spirosoma litoris]